MVAGMEGSLSCLAHQGGFMDELCSTPIFSGPGAGGSGEVCSFESSSCLQAERVSGSNDDQEGHPEHLYDMTTLMAQLPRPPLRRGLSRFYDGKSRSFQSLGSVKTVDDLREPEPDRRTIRGRRRRNGCKKQMTGADMHGCSKLSKVIRKTTRM